MTITIIINMINLFKKLLGIEREYEIGHAIGHSEGMAEQLAHSQELLERKAINLFCERGYPNPLHVFDISPTGIPYINQEPITKDKMIQLKSEAGLLKSMYLYAIIQESIRQEAVTKAVTHSKSWEEVLAGKMMLTNLAIIKKIINTISEVNEAKLPEGSGKFPEKSL